MAQVKKSENVPKIMQEKYKAIVEITDRFSKENLKCKIKSCSYHAGDISVGYKLVIIQQVTKQPTGLDAIC